MGPLIENDSALNGANGVVLASTTWDPDGAGPQAPMLVVGGAFSSIEGAAITNVAARNAAGQWQPLGAIFNGSVRALTVFNGQLIAAGNFNYIGANQINRIARWDGSTWHALSDGLYGPVTSLAIFNGQLIAGVEQYSSNPHVFRWSGSSWQPLDTGGGLGSHFGVYCLAVYNNNLIAGGSFGVVGSGVAYDIARWDGSTWHPLGTGVDGVYSSVYALSVYNNQLIAGGSFESAGGAPASKIARWNGATWQPLGAGLSGLENAYVSTLEVYNGSLIAGGFFNTAGRQWTSKIARWDGFSWHPLGFGIGLGTYSMPSDLWVHNGELVVTGSFSTAGDQTARNMARWSGSQWQAFGGVEVNSVNAFANFGTRLITGGSLQQLGAGGGALRNIVSWDGVMLSPLGAGMNDAVNSLMSFTHPGVNGDRELVAGGFFTTAGSVGANRVARWVEDPLVGFPPPQWAAMGNGFNGGVQALTRFNGTTVAGGYFTHSANGITPLTRIARWNETTDTWEAMGNGMNGLVTALKAYNSSGSNVRLVAGGYFTSAGTNPASSIAMWTENTAFPNTPAWVQMGSGFNGPVLALEFHNFSMYAAGAFTASGATGVNRIARWDTSLNPDAWVPVGGGFNGAVTSLKSSGGVLYAGGDFTMANGQTATRVAAWDGTAWVEVQGGADNSVNALGLYHNELHAGGLFNTVRNGAIASRGWAKYHETGVPWIVHQSSSQGYECHADALFTITPASGYDGLNYQWRKDGAPLSNGPTGSGSTIVANASSLQILNVGVADEGNYDCVLSNVCGNVTSSPATLTIRRIDVNDLLAMIGAWGACPAPCPPRCQMDLAPPGGDCIVDVNDLLIVIGAWGACR